jgi:hypothetical protein
MMIDILLDRDGDASLPKGYQLIDSEVDFLDYALINKPIMIRGERICNWAETFYRSRNIKFRVVSSPNRELLEAIPQLTSQQASEIISLLRENFLNLEHPITVPQILFLLHPINLWYSNPNCKHAAEWLVWLSETNKDEALQPLLKIIANQWEIKSQFPLQIIYQSFDKKSALEVLEGWLWINPKDYSEALGEFPLQIPTFLEDRIRRLWSREIIESRGSFFFQIIQKPIPQISKQIAAKETQRYLLEHPDELTQDYINKLSQFLIPRESNLLLEIIPPPEPSQLPESQNDVIDWFSNEYILYRSWQHKTRSENGKHLVEGLAFEFAKWYLDIYRRALFNQKMISFFEILSLKEKNDSKLILVVIFDGLSYLDSETVTQEILSESSRLSIFKKKLTYSPIPTITEFTKQTLFKGVSYNHIEEVSYLGEILPENILPTKTLEKAKPGNLYFWRVMEPDNTYHKRNHYQSLDSEIEAQLEAVAKKIANIVEAVPDNVQLQIVITTDHGRLQGSSRKEIQIPPNMQSHGRAAYGKCDKDFPEIAYIIEEKIVYLYGSEFGLNQDIAIPLDERSFFQNDGKTGVELYPHGGLFPEEVIIPWIIFERDLEQPKMDVKISGMNEAGKPGNLNVKIINYSEIELKLVCLEIDFGINFQVDLEVTIESRSDLLIHPRIYQWPSESQIERCFSNIIISQPDGRHFKVPAEIDLISKVMYIRDDNLLEGLDL